MTGVMAGEVDEFIEDLLQPLIMLWHNRQHEGLAKEERLMGLLDSLPLDGRVALITGGHTIW